MINRSRRPPSPERDGCHGSADDREEGPVVVELVPR
jgi:hypothetical protein